MTIETWHEWRKPALSQIKGKVSPSKGLMKPMNNGKTSVSATSRIRNSGASAASRTSMLHSEFGFRSRQLPATRSPHTRVSSFQASSWPSSSQASEALARSAFRARNENSGMEEPR